MDSASDVLNPPRSLEILGNARSPVFDALRRRMTGSLDPGAASNSAPPVLALDGRTTSTAQVAAARTRAPASPLIVIHAEREHVDALGLGISTGSSNAFVFMPEPAPHLIELHRAESGPMIYLARDGGDGAELVQREVQPGEIPPPELDPPRIASSVPDTPALGAEEAEAEALAERLERALRSRRPPLPSDPPTPPPGVLSHIWGAVTKVLSVRINDPYYMNKYAWDQVGELSITYRFTGYSNLDTAGHFQSYRLKMELGAGASPSLSGNLLTVAEHFSPSLYLGWFQSRLLVGVNAEAMPIPNPPFRRLGTSPNTINRETTTTTTKGFSFDVGFEVKDDGPTPKVGLNYSSEVSTETTFRDWAVGELSDDRKTFWQYSMAYPYNAAIEGDLVKELPDTADFTAQSTRGVDFVAAAVWDIPFGGGTPPILSLPAAAGWRLVYYFHRRGGATLGVFERDFTLPASAAGLKLDLGLIPLPPPAQAAEKEPR
jgi:hypothetical protein